MRIRDLAGAALLALLMALMALGAGFFYAACAERLPADDSSCCGPIADCEWCEVGKR